MCKCTVGTLPSQQHEAFGRRGDIVHWATLLNTLLFCICVIFFKDNAAIFDSTWSKDGFCVSNPTVPYWSSHDLCLYVDIFLAAVCGLAYYILHKEDGMEAANALVFANIFGIAAHGLGHGGIGAALRDENRALELDVSYFSTTGDKPWDMVIWEMFIDQGGYLIFFLFLLKATMPQSPMISVGPLAIVSWLCGLCIKPSLAFTYVQTVLLVAFSTNQLFLPKEDKGFAYFIYGLMVSFPLGIVGWIESTMCSSYVIHIGGHLIYDAWIPLSTLAFYLTCYVYRTSDVAKEIKAD